MQIAHGGTQRQQERKLEEADRGRAEAEAGLKRLKDALLELCSECINLSMAAPSAFAAPESAAEAHCHSRPQHQRGGRTGSNHRHPHRHAPDEGSGGGADDGDARGGGATCLDDAHRALERLAWMKRQQQQQQTVALVTAGDSSGAPPPPPQGRPRGQDGPPRAKMLPMGAEVGGDMGTGDDGEAPPSSSALDERHHESPEGEAAGRERRGSTDPRR